MSDGDDALSRANRALRVSAKELRKGCSEGPACPHCGCTFSRVLQARAPRIRNDYRRRRCCDDCGEKFTTHEKADQEVA